MEQSNKGLAGSNLGGRPELPVVFFANGLGDTILALPALRALVEMFPRRLTLVCDHGIYSSLLTELAFRKVVETRMKRDIPDWTREFSVSDVVGEIGECDFFISLVPWHSHSLRVLLSTVRPKGSIGFFDDFLIKVPLNFTQHAADLAFDLIRTLDNALRLEDYAAAPVLDAQSREIAQTIRQ